VNGVISINRSSATRRIARFGFAPSASVVDHRNWHRQCADRRTDGDPCDARCRLDPHDLAGETFIGILSVPRVLRAVINGYLKRCGIEIAPHLEIDNFAMDFSGCVDARSGSAAGLCREFLAVVCHQPSAKRQGVDHRAPANAVAPSSRVCDLRQDRSIRSNTNQVISSLID
jgi:hypothetical protein